MKHSLLAIAACAAACSAQAQSSVTLGGIADAGVRLVSNQSVGSNKSVISGGNNTSRLIVRGKEEIGGGLSANFHLEHGLSLVNGTQASTVAGQFWDRRATVGVASATLGEIRGGRDYVPTYNNWSIYDPFSVVGVASANALVSTTPVGPLRTVFGSNQNTTARANDSVQWILPSGWAGLEGSVMVSADAGPVAQGKNKVVGARLGWASERFRVSAATMSTQNDLTVTGKLKDHAVAGAADFGVVRVTAAWRRFAYAESRQTHALVGLTAPIGASGQLKASWQKLAYGGRVGATRIDDNGARQLGLGYVHNLSKRTALYASAGQLDNDGSTALAISGGNAGLPAGGRSRGYEVGMRHNF